MILVGFIFGVTSCFAQEAQEQQAQTQQEEVQQAIVIFTQITIMNVSSHFHQKDENAPREGAAPTN